MSTYDLPEESEWVVKSRKAAYCARRRFNRADDLTPQDMEDLIQTATLAYWKHHQDGRPVPFCFVCARQAAEKYFWRNILGRNPRSPLSLDAPLRDGGDLPHSPTPANASRPGSSWKCLYLPGGWRRFFSAEMRCRANARWTTLFLASPREPLVAPGWWPCRA